MIERFINFFQSNAEIISLLIFFIVSIINQLVNTLKSIFVANKAGWITYVAVAIDAVLYAVIVKSLSAQTFVTVMLYVLGKILGTYFGNIVESKIGVGIYDVEIYLKDHDVQKVLQDKLLSHGFSSTMNIGTVSDNKVRWSNNVQLKRKDMSTLYDILSDVGVENPTMVVRQAKKVTGKIEKHI